MMDAPGNRHYPNDNCGDPDHDRILEAWYARAEALLDRAAPRAEGLDVPPSNLLAEAMHSTRTPGHDSHAIEECIDPTYSLTAWAERVHDWLARFSRPSGRVPESEERPVCKRFRHDEHCIDEPHA